MSETTRRYRRPRVIDGRVVPYAHYEWAYMDDGHVARMGAPAWACLTYYMRIAGTEHELCASLEETAAATGLSRQGVCLARRRLLQLGYLAIATQGGGRGHPTTYIILPLTTVPVAAPAPAAVQDTAPQSPPAGAETVNDVDSLEAGKQSTTLTDQQEKAPTTLAQTVNDVGALRQRRGRFSRPPLEPPNKELREKQQQKADAAAVSPAANAEEATRLLLAAGVEPSTAARLVEARGKEALEAVRVAARNAEILAAAGDLRRTVPAYIVAAVEGRYAPLPEPPPREPALKRVERARTQAAAQASAVDAERRRLREDEARKIAMLDALGDAAQGAQAQAIEALYRKSGIKPRGTYHTNPLILAETFAIATSAERNAS